MIYGHSAVAQFVHRMVMFLPKARIKVAISANAGWYTMPSEGTAFPYGLSTSGSKLADVSVSFSKNLTILLGDEDVDENHKYLRKTPEAMSQGKHRFERGHAFYKTAVTRSEERGIKLKWKLKVVPATVWSFIQRPGMPSKPQTLLE